MNKIENLFENFGSPEWENHAHRLQNQERAEFEEFKKDHSQRVLKYMEEVRNTNPDAFRLLSIRAIISDNIAFLTLQKGRTLYHIGQIDLPGFLDPHVFLGYKKREIETIVEQYKELLESVIARIELRKAMDERVFQNKDETKPPAISIALFLNYLMNARIEVRETNPAKLGPLLKKYGFEDFSANSIRGHLYKLDKDGYFNKEHLMKAIGLLSTDKAYVNALTLAKNDLVQLTIDDS